MSSVANIILSIALIAVAVVLGLGLWSMLRGRDPSRSQKLMRWRIVLQAIAIVILLTAVYFARG